MVHAVTGLPAFTLPAPHGSLIVAGAQRVHVTGRPHHQLVGSRIGVHQGAKAPKHGDQFGVWQVAAHHIQKGSYALWHRNGGGLRIPIDRGALVGTARVADCVPIVQDGWPANEPWRPALVLEDDTLTLYRSDDPYDCTGQDDQLPFADFTPGRWALLLDDARPTTAPNGCPACGGIPHELTTGTHSCLHPGCTDIYNIDGTHGGPPCPTCSGSGSCPPVSGVSGRAGCWTWTPEGAT